jgi:hypothetical protein
MLQLGSRLTTLAHHLNLTLSTIEKLNSSKIWATVTRFSKVGMTFGEEKNCDAKMRASLQHYCNKFTNRSYEKLLCL